MVAASSASERRYTPRYVKDGGGRLDRTAAGVDPGPRAPRRRRSRRQRDAVAGTGLRGSTIARLRRRALARLPGHARAPEPRAQPGGGRGGPPRPPGWWRQGIAGHRRRARRRRRRERRAHRHHDPSAARRAAAEGERKCNGDADNCDRTLAEIDARRLPQRHVVDALPRLAVRRAGRHDQGSARRRRAGPAHRHPLRRAVGVEDGRARRCRSCSPIGPPSCRQPTGEDYDPAIAQRASQLAARAPAKAGATRQIYLCHNYCEMGAVSFASVLGDVKKFVDTHPDDVVALIIQDATTPADTADGHHQGGPGRSRLHARTGPAPADAGRDDRRGQDPARLRRAGRPGRAALVPEGVRLVPGDAATTSSRPSDFTCAPNRGPADAPLFLVNHWVNASPPDPGKAAQANDPKLLKSRLEAVRRRAGPRAQRGGRRLLGAGQDRGDRARRRRRPCATARRATHRTRPRPPTPPTTTHHAAAHAPCRRPQPAPAAARRHRGHHAHRWRPDPVLHRAGERARPCSRRGPTPSSAPPSSSRAKPTSSTGRRSCG